MIWDQQEEPILGLDGGRGVPSPPLHCCSFKGDECELLRWALSQHASLCRGKCSRVLPPPFYWGYIGDIVGLYWGYIGDILGKYWGYIGDSWKMKWKLL